MSEGYKKTELGEIPEHWEIVKQEEVAIFYNGRAFKLSEWEEEGTPVIRLQNLTGSGKEFYYSKLKLPDHQYCNNGDLLYMWSATFGPVWWKGSKAIFHYHIWKIEVNENRLDKVFHFYMLDDVTLRMKNQSHGSTMLHVTKSGMESLKIVLPPLKEQQKIGEILSTVDEKIDVIDAQISQTTELKKGLMQKLLTKGIGHTEFKDSFLGEVPNSWNVLKLERITNKIGDGLHATPKYVADSEWHFINGNNLVNGKIEVTEKTKCVSQEEFSKHYRDLGSDTLLMSINGTIGNLAFYKGEKVILGKSAAFISCSNQINVGFLYYLLQSNSIKEYYKNELTGTAISNLSLKSIRNTPIPLPPKEEQQKIKSILNVVDDKIHVLEEKRDRYQVLKKGLMQQLLSGRIRIKQTIKPYESAQSRHLQPINQG